MDFSVDSESSLTYDEAALACARTEFCQSFQFEASMGDPEAIGDFRQCISICLRAAGVSDPTIGCETCFVELAFHALIECINPCVHESDRCAPPDTGCACESCLCGRDYFATLSGCTGIAYDLCGTL
jgi:hypothetical protein